MKRQTKKKKSEFRKGTPPYPQTLPRELRDRLIALGEEIHGLTAARRYDEAEKLCQSGLGLIPNPVDAYIETTWYLSALGDIYFLQGKYPLARENCEKALHILKAAGASDPFILLRLGEIALETGDEAAALRYLLNAYKAEGWEIFDGQDRKYRDFLKNTLTSTKNDITMNDIERICL